MGYFDGKTVIVTGGNGFLGRYVVARLDQAGCKKIIIPRSAEYDLTEENAIIKLFEKAKANIVIHLAASVGGIGANQQNPGPFFYNNAVMGLQLIEQARLFGIDKFVIISLFR